VCSFDALQQAAAGASPFTSPGVYKDPGGVYNSPPRTVPASDPSVYHVTQSASVCISSNQTDPLSNLHRSLMQNGCSQPYYYEAFNSQFGPSNCTVGGPWNCWEDKSNGWLLLCPNNATINSLVNNAGTLSYQGQVSDISARIAGGGVGYAGPFPYPPSGWEWAVTWEDPHGCGVSGCMSALY
jgi:hypothetical protein